MAEKKSDLARDAAEPSKPTAAGATDPDSAAAGRREDQQAMSAGLESPRQLQTLAALFLKEGALAPVLEQMVDAAIAISGSDFGNIQLVDRASGDLRVVAQRGLPDAWVEFWDGAGKGHGASGNALERRQRVIIEDVERSPIFLGRPELEVHRNAGVRAVQSTPLMSRAGELLGVLSTHYRKPGRPPERALRLLDLLASQAADILQRQRTEADLRASEEKYRSLFQSIDEGFCVIEVLFDDDDRPNDYRFLEVNPSFERQTGIHDAVGRRMLEIAPQHEQRWFRIYGEIALSGGSRRFEHAAQGLGRHFDVYAFRIGVPEQRHVAIVLNDITVRKRVESELERHVAERTQELSTQRSRTKAIIDTAVDAIITIDERGIIDLFNPSAERMFGYRADEVLGKNVKMLMPAPFAGEHDGYLQAYLRTGVAKIIGIGREVVGLRKDGSTFPVDLAVAEIKGGETRRFVGTMRDLTAVKRAREELEREHALSEGVVSTARVIILRLDERGRILSFNRYMEELCGYSLEEVRGKDWFETFLAEGERTRMRETFAHALEGNRTNGVINPIRTRGGSEVLVEWYDSTLELPGEAPSLIAIGHDVTARSLLEKEYLQAQKMEAVGRLAGGVAHDVNNLLAGIIGGLRIASKELTPKHPARAMLHEVQQEVERGAAITRRLLDFSRMGKRKPSLIDPGETIRAGERMMRRLIGEDIEVHVLCDASDSRILADPHQIEQAVLNLAINARDAMPRGGTLTVRCAHADLSAADVERLGGPLEPGAHVVLSVEDTGCGMDAETLGRATEPFFTTKTPGLGTGLGLSSVATMAGQLGGHLAIESELGQGTRVRLFLPRRAAVVAPPESAAARRPLAPGGGERILLVEDEMLVRLGVQHVLGELGYTITAAKDPATALSVLEASEQPFDLLLTDVVLPGMSGPELAAVVKETSPGMRVLLMSAFPTEELVARGRISAGTPTLEKPFSDERLASGIRQALADEASGAGAPG